MELIKNGIQDIYKKKKKILFLINKKLNGYIFLLYNIENILELWNNLNFMNKKVKLLATLESKQLSYVC